MFSNKQNAYFIWNELWGMIVECCDELHIFSLLKKLKFPYMFLIIPWKATVGIICTAHLLIQILVSHLESDLGMKWEGIISPVI